MVFFPIRTDDSFRQRMQSSYHRGECIFEELNIDMVKCLPLDPMHLVYLGVVRKLISLWEDLAKKNEMHVNRLMLENIDGKVLPCAGRTLRDFPRKCRGLTEVSRWKATECRLFLLYLGPDLVKDIMPLAIYRNFQRLSFAVCLLSQPKYYRNYLEGCRVELLNFLNEFEVIYGREHLIYNIHCLQHLAEDVNEITPLESFSAFPFESYMQTIRQSIHSNNAIAKQAAHRFAEKVFHDCNSRALHKGKKTYAVLRKAGSKELFKAARNWMPSDDMCLYYCSVTGSEGEACIRSRPDWLLIDCQILAEQEAKSTLLTAKRIHSILSNSDSLEETLSLTNSKRQRREMQSIKGEMQCIKGEMESHNRLVTQLVSVNKSTGVTILGNGKSSIDNSQLEASLKNPKFKDSLVSLQLTFHYAQVTKSAGNLFFNPQSSLRRMLNYVLEPKLSNRFTAFGTPNNRHCQHVRLSNNARGRSYAKFDKDCKGLLPRHTWSCSKKREPVAVDNKKNDQRISPESDNLTKLML
ncbi:unnamed protein product [Trichobilharzia regenti]|nr:unnamed protein product [Trichobilharzia regenti]